MSERQDYYVPKTIEEKKSGMALEGVSAEMMNMADSNGMIKVTLENDVTIEKIARDLYKDPKAGIRELVNNEARPCRTAIKKGHEAMIYVTINGDTRTVVIEGRGSMGMTMKTFRDVFTVLGRSGNFDGDESGQFGFGRASYLCLSDIMVFETYSRETNERFGFLGKGGKVYEPIPEHMLSIKEHGTKITLTVREDIEIADLVEYTKEVSRFLGVPVMLDIPTNIMYHTSYGSTNRYESSLSQIGPVSVADYLSREGEEPQFVEIDNDDYNLVGSLSYVNNDNLTCLIGIPVEMDGFPFDDFGGYVLNIKNERKYMPTASRDSMSADSASRLNAKIKRDLKKHFASVTIDSVSDCVDNGKKLYTTLSVRTLIDWGFDQSVIDFVRLNDETFRSASAKNGLPGRGYDSNRRDVVTAYENYKRIFYLHSVNRPRVTAFLKTDPDAIVLFTSGSAAEKRATGALFERFGVQKLSDYMKKNQIKVVKNKETEVVMHSASSGYTERAKLKDLSGDCIRLPADVPLRDSLDQMRDSCFGNFWFVKDSKLVAGTRSVTLDSFCNKVLKKKFETSDGLITGRQILKKYKDSIIVLDSEFSKIYDMTAEKCAKILNVELVVVDNNIGYSEISNITKLKLACKAKYPDRDFSSSYVDNCYFSDISSHGFKRTIIDSLTKCELGIDVDGDWKSDPATAVEHIGQIKNIPVRNLYAFTFNHTINGYGWDLEHNAEPIKELHDRMLKIDSAADGKSLIDLCQEIVSENIKNDSGAFVLNSGDMYSGGDRLARWALRHIIEHFTKNDKKASRYDPDDVDLLANVLNAVMGNVITGNIKTEYKDSSKDDMKIILDSQPISVLPGCLILDIVDRMPARHRFVGTSITADNKLEIHI